MTLRHYRSSNRQAIGDIPLSRSCYRQTIGSESRLLGSAFLIGTLLALGAAAGILTTGCSGRGDAKPPKSAPRVQRLSFEAAWTAAKSRPADVNAKIALARAAWKEYPGIAMRALLDSLRIDPGSAQASTMLSTLYEEHGYTDRQIETLKARLKRCPNDLYALINAAPIELSLGRTSRAERMFARAIKLAPYDPAVVKAVTLFYYDQKETQRAIPILHTFLAKMPGASAFWDMLSESERSLGQYREAEDSIRRAIHLAPKNPAYHRQLAHILVTSGMAQRLAEAEREIRLALKLGDESIDGQYWLAVILDHENRIPEAIAAYAAVAKRDASYESTAYRLGSLYEQTDRLAEGKRLLQLYGIMDRNRLNLNQAVSDVSRHANRPQSYSRLAGIYEEMGSYGLSIALLRQASARFPRDSAITRQLKAALLSAGRRTEAIKT